MLLPPARCRLSAAHMEMTVDLRNLLAQGYVGIQSAAAPLLTNAPRAVRGGLNFIF